MASDQGLHCLLTGFPMKNRIKMTNGPDTPKMTNGLIQHITVVVVVVVVVALLFYVHGKHLRSCRDGQLT